MVQRRFSVTWIRGRRAAATAAVVATAMAFGAASAAAQLSYAELHYVMQSVGAQGSAPGNDVGSLSVQQLSGGFQAAILADVTTRSVGVEFEFNLCAARDLSPLVTVPASGAATNLCTGLIAIGKQGGPITTTTLWPGIIEFVGQNRPGATPPLIGVGETAAQEIGGMHATPQTPGAIDWLSTLPAVRIATSYGIPIDMDVAVGTTTSGTSQLESWLITTEVAPGVTAGTATYAICSYYLTPMNAPGAGGAVAPVPGPVFVLPPAMVVDNLIVLSDPTGAQVWIMFIDTATAGAPIAHVVDFTMTFNNGGAGSFFGTIDPPTNVHGMMTATPPAYPGLPLLPMFPAPPVGPTALGSIVNMWEAQNPGAPGSFGDVGISFRDATNPQTAPGNFAVIPAGPAAPAAIGIAGLGGGPVTHIPSMAAGGPGGIALEATPGSGVPFGPGWYVTTPGTPWTMTAINRLGAAAFAPSGAAYSIPYPAGAAPSGPILSHRGDQAMYTPPVSSGFVGMPYLDATGFRFQVASQSSNVVHATGIASNVVANYGAPPAFPVQHMTPIHHWPGALVYRARTSNRMEYGLRVPGW